MASGLTKWIGAAVLLCGALAAWLLPPTGEWIGDLGARPREPSPERVRARELSAEVVRTTGLLARLHIADRFHEELHRRGVEEAVVVIPLDEPWDAAAEGWRRRAEAEPGPADGGRDGIPVAAFLLDRWQDLPGGRRIRHRGSSEYYLLERPSGAVCAVAIFLPLRRDPAGEPGSGDRGDLDDAFPGPCALLGAHGLPGPGIARWLEEGGYLFADDPTTSGSVPLEAVSRKWGIFGIRGRYAGRPPPTAERCLTGRLEACDRWFRAPGELERGFFRWSATIRDQVRHTELIHGDWPYRDPVEVHLLADLQAEFGPGLFREFWRSEESVEEAFAGAFGEPASTWMHGWAVARYGEEPRGPSPGLLTSLLSLATLGGTFLVGAWVAERRTVD